MQMLLPLPLPLADVLHPTVLLLPKLLRCAAATGRCANVLLPPIAAAVQLLNALCHCLHLHTSAATHTPATQTARVTEAKLRQPLLVPLRCRCHCRCLLLLLLLLLRLPLPLPQPPLRCCSHCGCSSNCRSRSH